MRSVNFRHSVLLLLHMFTIASHCASGWIRYTSSHTHRLSPLQLNGRVWVPYVSCTLFVVMNSYEIFLMSYIRRLQIREDSRATVPILDSKRTRRRHEVTEDKLDEIGAGLQRTTNRSLVRLVEQTGIFVCTLVRYETELLPLELL
jgi:hypothetical protein